MSEPEPHPEPLPLLPQGAPEPDRWGWRIVALVSLPVLALLAVGLVLAAGSGRAPEEGPPESAVATIAPAAAWDGKESMMLPVTATPATALVDGQAIVVTGEGFPPGADVGVVMCTSQAAFGGGAGYCDIMDYEMATVDAQGTFRAQYQVRRFLEAGGVRWDCTGGNVDPAAYLEARAAGTLAPDLTTWSCIIAAGVLTDYDISGGMPIAFAPDGPIVDPVALDASACQYVHTAAGIVPTCPGMEGGPSPVCAAEEVVAIADDGTATCEPVPVCPDGQVGAVGHAVGEAPGATTLECYPSPSSDGMMVPGSPSAPGTAPPAPQATTTVPPAATAPAPTALPAPSTSVAPATSDR